MGGGDKSLQMLGGRPILTHVIERLTPQVESMVLNVNGNPARFAAWNLPTAPDDIAGTPGPMAGIIAGLAWAAQKGCDKIVSVPTDTPFLPDALVEQLSAARDRERAEIAVAASGAYTHYATALWPTNLESALRQKLSYGVRKLEDFMRAYRVAVVNYGTDDGDPFFNINSPEDLAEAQKRASA